MTLSPSRLAVALVHHPVMNKRGEIVTTSVTTLDVHDMARLCKTYEIGDLFIVTPLKSQRRLVERLTRHWTEGFGSEYNPSRKEALTDVKVVDSIDVMLDNLRLDGARVRLIFTGAKRRDGAIGFSAAREMMEEARDERLVILFGTGYGLADTVFEQSDIHLAPIEGLGGFNHLPVRCAAAIILDRLLGGRD